MGVDRADFYRFGLRRDVLLPRLRTVAAVDADADTITVPSNGWTGSEYLTFSVVPASATTPVLPGGIGASTVYRPLPVEGSSSLAKLSLTEGGSPIDITGAGDGAFQVEEDLGPLIDSFLETWQARVEAVMPAHRRPLADPLPRDVVWVICKRAAYDMAVTHTLVTPSYWEQNRETIAAQDADAKARMDQWRKGEADVDAIDATPDVLENGAVSILPGATSSGWRGAI